jgi:hypothetical protein
MRFSNLFRTSYTAFPDLDASASAVDALLVINR